MSGHISFGLMDHLVVRLFVMLLAVVGLEIHLLVDLIVVDLLLF